LSRSHGGLLSGTLEQIGDALVWGVRVGQADAAATDDPAGIYHGYGIGALTDNREPWIDLADDGTETRVPFSPTDWIDWVARVEDIPVAAAAGALAEVQTTSRDGDRITGAEFAAYRHLIGLTIDELAAALRVNPRTARAWESGRDPISTWVPEELDALVLEHRALALRLADDGRPIAIRRDKTAAADKPRGWYIAAAARAMEVKPDLQVEWS
jgi:DNA-binding XRE family transcriptional regulator